MSWGYGSRAGSASGYGNRGGTGYGASSGGGSGGATKKHGSLLDKIPGGKVIEHLGSDVKDAILGIPEGLVQTVEHPIGTVKAIGKQYAQTYSPLFHGDIGAFLHGVGQHPLGPLLDLASLLTLGGAGAAKFGLVDDALKQVELRGPAALEGLDATNVVAGKALSRNPVRRVGQETVDRGLKKLPADTPVVGELARFGREVRRGAVRDEAGRRLVMGDFSTSMAKLSQKERDALGVLARVPLPQDLEAWKGMLARESAGGNTDAAAALAKIADPKVAELYANPTGNMLAAHAELAKLGQHQAALLNQYGALTPALADTARFRHMRLARGAETYTPGSAKKTARQIDRQLRQLRRQQDTLGQVAVRLRQRGTPELRQLRRDATQSASQASRKIGTTHRAQEATGKLDEIRTKLEAANSQIARLMSRHDLSSQEMLDAGLRTGRNSDLLRLRMIARYHDQATTLAHRYESAYNQLVKREGLDAQLPSRAELSARQLGEVERLHQTRSDIAGRLTAGRKELDRLASIEQQLEAKGHELRPGIVGGPPIHDMKAELAAAGRPEPVYVPDVAQAALDKKGLRRNGAAGKDVTVAAKSPVHRSEGTLFLLGKLALDPALLGPEYLKTVRHAYYRDIHDQLLEAAIPVPYRRGERPALKPGYVWIKRPNEKISYLDNLPSGAGALTSTNLDDAAIDAGLRYAVPERLANQLSADFHRSNKVIAAWFDKPTTVWRALTLNLRVGWLVNNVVGNHLLYAVKHAGPAGLHAYLNAIRTSKGGATVDRLLKIHPADALGPSDVAELFPEHSSAGTFLGTQNVKLPEGRAGDVVRTAVKPFRGLSQANQGSEGALRRASLNAGLRRAPEVRARLKAMPKETRSFRQAAREELAANPGLAREISDKVDATLGNFLNMSPAARHYVRGLFPFIAWYRAILQIGFKLPLDSPVRASILTRLGEIGQEASTNELGPLPSYLKGAIPLGGDRILKTQGVNPLATITQLAPGVGALISGHPGDAATGELASNLNPFIQALIQQISGKNVFTGAPVNTPSWASGLLGGVGETVGAGLPQVRLAKSLTQGPPVSKLYVPSALDELMAFLGVPTRTLNRGRAAELAAQGK